MSRKYRRTAVRLPRGVHKVTARGREYFYFQPGRGSIYQGERIRLPDDPQLPEFWNAIRQAQGLRSVVRDDTVGALIDAFLSSPAYDELKQDTKYRYTRHLGIAKKAWGDLPKDQLRPSHVRAVMDGFAKMPGKANAFLVSMQGLSKWARVRDLLNQSITEGVERYAITGGHKPWTDEQIAEARKSLRGMIRRAIMLYIYTGQRGSDIMRLGWTDIDEGGFGLGQKKTGVEVWCPIVPELAEEMAGWKKEPGPFLKTARGLPFSRKYFSGLFKREREKYPILKDVRLHGLRATAVIRLRRAGLTPLQIQDIVGMSLAMIERYCRFADKKAGGKAALISLAERRKNKTVKH